MALTSSGYTGTTINPTYSQISGIPIADIGATPGASAPIDPKTRLTNALLGASSGSSSNNGSGLSNPVNDWFSSLGSQPTPGSPDWWTAYNQGGFSSAPMSGDPGAWTAPPGAHDWPANPKKTLGTYTNPSITNWMKWPFKMPGETAALDNQSGSDFALMALNMAGPYRSSAQTNPWQKQQKA